MFPKAKDLTSPFKNFRDLRKSLKETDKRELCSMIDLSSCISNDSRNTLLVLDVVYNISEVYVKEKSSNPHY
jgi:hypothetical protein